MFRITWVNTIAIGLILLSVGLTYAQQVESPTLKGDPVAKSGQSQSASNTNNNGASKQQKPPSFVTALDRIETAIRDLIAKEDKIERERKQNQEIRDLNAQEEMAIWAERMFWATVATVLVAAVGIFYVRKTIIGTRQASVDQTRGYVHVDSAEIRWNSETTPDPEVLLTIINTGQTPVRWFEIEGICKTYKYGVTPKSIEDAGFIRDQKKLRWHSLAGQNELHVSLNTQADKSEIIKALERRETQGLNAIGLVRYETIFDEIFESEFDFIAIGVRSFRHASPPENVSRKPMLEDGPVGKFASKITDRLINELSIKMSRGTLPLRVYEKIGKNQ